MMPIVLIVGGVILAFFGSIKLLKFTETLSSVLEEINSLYGTDAFKSHSELRSELDELNYSYYEILDRQDERISSVEESVSRILNAEKPLDYSEGKDIIEEEKDVESAEFIPPTDFTIRGEEDEGDIFKFRILSLYQSGISSEEIAKILEIDIGTVELVCALYGGSQGEA